MMQKNMELGEGLGAPNGASKVTNVTDHVCTWQFRTFDVKLLKIGEGFMVGVREDVNELISHTRTDSQRGRPPPMSFISQDAEHSCGMGK
jgi:hypothetical protein